MYYRHTLDAIVGQIRERYPNARPSETAKQTDMPSYLLWMADKIKENSGTSPNEALNAARSIGWMLCAMEFCLNLKMSDKDHLSDLVKSDVADGNDYFQNSKPIGIGVNVFVHNEHDPRKFLLGKRKNSTGAGQWCLPGGKLDKGESLKEAALRESFEETGIALTKLDFAILNNDPRPDLNEHWLHVNYRSVTSQEPIVNEPDKCDGWGWFTKDNLPSPIFYGHKKLIAGYLAGEVVCD